MSYSSAQKMGVAYVAASDADDDFKRAKCAGVPINFVPPPATVVNTIPYAFPSTEAWEFSDLSRSEFWQEGNKKQ